MNRILPGTIPDTELLGVLAAKFRGTRRDSERQTIAQEYSQAVGRLIRDGWAEIPAPEDQLPDKWMPKAFFDYWLQRGMP